MTPTDDYFRLLARYHAMVRGEPWWDGRRDDLVREMDAAWLRLNAQGREDAMVYAHELYARGLRPAA